jgi:PiT family inorganic phosphate transporter
MTVTTILIVLTLLAGFYMAWNIGANDVANAMGTSVGSGALTLRRALIIAAILEFSGSFLFGSNVSQMVQSGIVNSEIFSRTPILLAYGMLSALIATGIWLQIASYFGWPVSTTHAIVGGVIGFGAIIGGVEAIYWDNVAFIVSSWVLSPILGAASSYVLFTILRNKILYAPDPIRQAKKIAPIFVFIVAIILSLVVIYRSFEDFGIQLGNPEVFVLALLCGLIIAGISHLLIKKIKEPSVRPAGHSLSPATLDELGKVSEHLKHLQGACTKEVEYRVATLVEEVDDLKRSIKQAEETPISSNTYTVVEKIFAYLQIMSACLMAFAHGANDVANAIGPLSAAISVLRFGTIPENTEVPAWALALGGFGIVVGLATWGWRVIDTIGKKITELTPTRGFAAEFGAAATILLASRMGLPISTTHTLVGSVIGVGLARGIEAINLATTRDIVISWILTIPASAAMTVVVFYILNAIFS